jgi:hypothetical protein
MMKKFFGLWLFVAVLVAAPAHATNYCGGLLPPGDVYLDQNQECFGGTITMQSYTRLHGNGFYINCHGGGNGLTYTGPQWVALYGVGVYNCPGAGIDVKNAVQVWIEGSEFSANGGSGIRIDRSKRVTIKDTAVIGNGSWGINLSFVDNTTPTVGSSHIYAWNNGITGVYLDQTIRFRSVYNSIGGNGFRGVDFVQFTRDSSMKGGWLGGNNGKVAFSSFSHHNSAKTYSSCDQFVNAHDNQCLGQ